MADNVSVAIQSTPAAAGQTAATQGQGKKKGLWARLVDGLKNFGSRAKDTLVDASDGKLDGQKKGQVLAKSWGGSKPKAKIVREATAPDAQSAFTGTGHSHQELLDEMFPNKASAPAQGPAQPSGGLNNLEDYLGQDWR